MYIPCGSTQLCVMSQNLPLRSPDKSEAPIEHDTRTNEDSRPLQRLACQPRLLRLRDAPRYLGMDKNRFNRQVRPWVTVIPIGRRGLAFDRLDLDAWVDDYKRCNGHPSARTEGAMSWQPTEWQ